MTFEKWIQSEDMHTTVSLLQSLQAPDEHMEYSRAVWHAAQRAAFERAAEVVKWSMGVPDSTETVGNLIRRIRSLEPK